MFTDTLKLRPGDFKIIVFAEDAAGNRNSSYVNVRVLEGSSPEDGLPAHYILQRLRAGLEDFTGDGDDVDEGGDSGDGSKLHFVPKNHSLSSTNNTSEKNEKPFPYTSTGILLLTLSLVVLFLRYMMYFRKER